MLRVISNAKLPGARYFTSVIGSVHKSQLAGLSDSLIRVNENDEVLGPIAKLDSHLADAIKGGITHRAFSLFLFSHETCSLLIQKRAETKIVFPRQWANTCCSHPLYEENEMENMRGDHIGIKRSAAKRLDAELGIPSVNPASLVFKEKILYRQISPGDVFGESECDYILVGRESENFILNANKNEVEESAWIRPGPARGSRTLNLRKFMEEQTKLGFAPTPWFDLMLREPECLESWWEKMMKGPEFFMSEEASDEGKIRNFL